LGGGGFGEAGKKVPQHAALREKLGKVGNGCWSLGVVTIGKNGAEVASVIALNGGGMIIKGLAPAWEVGWDSHEKWR